MDTEDDIDNGVLVFELCDTGDTDISELSTDVESSGMEDEVEVGVAVSV